MNQPLHPKSDLPSDPQPGILQQVDSSTLGGGMQAAMGDDDVQIQGAATLLLLTRRRFYKSLWKR